MRFFAAAFSLALSAALAAAQTTTPLLNTPTGVQECFRTQLTWTGGTGPYQILVLPGGQPSAAPLEDLGDMLTGNSFSWLCKEAAGTSVFLRLKDTASGQTSDTAAVTVAAGNPALCGASNSTSAATSGVSQPAAATSLSVSAPGVTTAPVITTAPTTGGGNTGTSKPQSSNPAKTSSGSASAPSSSQGGAGQLKAPIALAVSAALAMAVFA